MARLRRAYNSNIYIYVYIYIYIHLVIFGSAGRADVSETLFRKDIREMFSKAFRTTFQKPFSQELSLAASARAVSTVLCEPAQDDEIKDMHDMSEMDDMDDMDSMSDMSDMYFS